MGADFASTLYHTAYQMLLTAPYAVGFTYILVVVFRKFAGKKRIPWDRMLRIFFTLGILFAFFFALYEYAAPGDGPLEAKDDTTDVSRFLPHKDPKQQ